MTLPNNSVENSLVTLNIPHPNWESTTRGLQS